jgi:hypothetical protein
MTTQPSNQKTWPDLGNPHAFVYSWTALGNGDDGQIIAPDYVGSADRTVQVEGTFGAAGTVVWEGSNDKVNFHTLRDPFGVALSFAAADVRQVTEATLYMRPRVTGGDDTTALIITAMLRKTFK